jgi:hypothetical protein
MNAAAQETVDKFFFHTALIIKRIIDCTTKLPELIATWNGSNDLMTELYI